MNLPPITSSHVSRDEAIHELVIPSDFPAFVGHFPGHPILPGVTQVDWVARLAGTAWGLAPVAREFQVKFRNIIAPGASVTLLLRYDRAKRHVHFEYRNDDRVMSSGRISVEPVSVEPVA